VRHWRVSFLRGSLTYVESKGSCRFHDCSRLRLRTDFQPQPALTESNKIITSHQFISAPYRKIRLGGMKAELCGVEQTTWRASRLKIQRCVSQTVCSAGA